MAISLEINSKGLVFKLKKNKKKIMVFYIGVFNFRYTVLLFLKLDIKYSLTTIFGYKVYRVFLNFGILHKF